MASSSTTAATHVQGLCREALAQDARQTRQKGRVIWASYNRLLTALPKPQHPLDPNRRAAIARLGIERRDQPAQRIVLRLLSLP